MPFVTTFHKDTEWKKLKGKTHCLKMIFHESKIFFSRQPKNLQRILTWSEFELANRKTGKLVTNITCRSRDICYLKCKFVSMKPILEKLKEITFMVLKQE